MAFRGTLEAVLIGFGNWLDVMSEGEREMSGIT